MAAALAAHGHSVTLLEITTTGDRWSARDGAPPADRGMFVKELEQALLDGRAHLAVHSAKDLPTDLPDGLAVLATPPREDPRDVLVGCPQGLQALPEGARVGTGSPRRRAQLLCARPDLEVVPIRGNVDTRLGRVSSGQLDAVVLAAAGLSRLGITRDDVVPLDVLLSTPAPGQALLAIEGRVDDADTCAAVAPLNDAAAATALRTERAVLSALGGGCFSPVGALCVATPTGLRLDVFRSEDADGTGAVRAVGHGTADDPDALVRVLLDDLTRAMS